MTLIGRPNDLEPITYFLDTVSPAIEEFLEAESDLSKQDFDIFSSHLKQCAYRALRRSASAAFLMHHFAQVVAQRPLAHMPNFQGSAKRVRKWIEAQDVEYAGNNLRLLEDAVEAILYPKPGFPLPFELRANGQIFLSSKIGPKSFRSILTVACNLWLKNLGIDQKNAPCCRVEFSRQHVV